MPRQLHSMDARTQTIILTIHTSHLLPGGGEYCIATCIPKQNNAEGTVKLIIPALVNGNQVSVLGNAFRWEVFNTDVYSPLNVELEFRPVQNPGTGNTEYVGFPTSLGDMFRECGDGSKDATNKISKTKIDLSGANLSNATTLRAMFYNCFRLSSIDFGNPDTSNVTEMSYMFGYCSALHSIDVSKFNTSSVTTMRSMFYGCSSLKNLDISNFDTTNVKNMAYMFYKCSSLQELDLSNFNTSKVTDMSYMFNGCSSLGILDVSNFNTSKVTNMAYMFYNCSTLENLDVSRFNTGKVTDMHLLFYGCSNLEELDVSNFNTSNVTDMSYMFNGCSSVSILDVSNFNTSKVTNMAYVFYGCSGVSVLDVSNFDTSLATKMQAMFYSCSSLENLDLSSFDTNNVTDMHAMFYNCSAIKTLDVSNFDTSQVENVQWLLDNCTNLELLRVSPDFVIPSVNGYMFEDAKSDMRVIGNGGLEFVETSGNVKSAINDEANKVYVVFGDLGISESLRTTLATQLPDARFAEEIDPTALFGATFNDAAYIGMSTSGQTIAVDGSTQTIATNLINKTISGIGYYPANLLLTGSIIVSGDNTEFNENSLIVGDRVKTTTIVFTNPKALPRTDTIVESNAL